jgi:putative heme iron utilization protein
MGHIITLTDKAYIGIRKADFVIQNRKTMSTSAAGAEARALFNTKDFGVLSTLSVRLGGFPFGSVVPYCTDGEGKPVVLISTIAQHTQNILADPRVSLTVFQQNEGDVQAKGRVTVIGNMGAVPETETGIADRYYQYFPQSKGYHQAHDFSFYRLEPTTVRYIGGFGKIHWVEPTDFLRVNPFFGKAEERVVSHMNEDHLHNLKGYCHHFKQLEVGEEDTLRMTGIDPEGFDCALNDRKIRFVFEEPVTNAAQARAALVKMAELTRGTG